MVLRTDNMLAGTPKFNVTENGAAIAGVTSSPLDDSELSRGIVIAIDVSEKMRESNRFDLLLQAVTKIITERPADVPVAIVTFGTTAEQEVGFTTDTPTLLSHLTSLPKSADRAMWDGLRRSATLFQNRPELEPTLFVFTAGPDTASTTTAQEAKVILDTANVSTFAVGVRNVAAADSAEVASAISPGAGVFVEAANNRAIAARAESVIGASHQEYVVRYTTRPAKTEADGLAGLTVSVNGGPATQAEVSRRVVTLAKDLTPTFQQADRIDKASRSFDGPFGLLVVLIAVVAAAGFAAYVVGRVFDKEQSLQSILKAYDGEKAEQEVVAQRYVETRLLQRALAKTEQIASDRGFLDRVEYKLERAELNLRPAEAILFTIVSIGLLTIATFFLKGPLFAILIGVAAGVFPFAFVNIKISRRMKKFRGQLPDMLHLLAGALKTGYSLVQAVDSVSRQVEDPMGKELRQSLQEANLGKPIEDAFDSMAARVAVPDFTWAVMAIRIQREVGGNLAELLTTVAETMIQRERLRREIKALTAEGRVSALVLGCLTPGIAVAMYLLNRDYMTVLFTDRRGEIALGAATVWMCLGFWWMKKMIEVDV